jgi:phosphoribosylanthranilate isomerase|tara:strand:+ start:3195 stop:3812 length:618 start_codon:yes stop_codon:yes gene_type:complete
MKVKICGLSNAEEVKTCISLNANFCGFILNYPKSHRYITFDKAVSLTNIDSKKTQYVGVFVNPKIEELKKFSKINLDYFQIYGDYTNEEINEIKSSFNKKIIFALQIKKKEDINQYKKISRSADIILWDSSGLEQSLEWNLNWIKSIPNNITKMVAGNISIDKLEKVSRLADIVDVSGALETNKVKDINKIKNFLNKVKKINAKN